MPKRKKKEKTIPSNIVNNTSSVPLGIPRKKVTPELVERRAREFALLKGRSLDQIHESDRRQARLELLGPSPTGGVKKRRRKTQHKS